MTGKKVQGSLFDRLALGDLCWIYLNYKNGFNQIGIPWNEDSDYINTYQTTEIDEDGNITIKVNKENEDAEE